MLVVSGASYETLHETFIASVLFDFALREREASQTKLMQKVLHKALYEARLVMTRKTRLYAEK